MSPGLTESLAESPTEDVDDVAVAPSECEGSAGSGSRSSHADTRPMLALSAELCGVGMWTAAHESFDAWVAAGMPQRWSEPESPSRPPASLLHSRLRRRTSTLTRAAVTAIEGAIETSGAELAEVRFVIVSSFGEIDTTVALLSQLAVPGGPVSPTKFHNSVHNTATGYLSIAAGNHCEATALAGGPHSLEVGLLEVLAGIADSGEDALLVFAEERLPAPFERDDAEQTFAVALHLAALGPAPRREGLGLELRMSSSPAPRTPAAIAPGVGGVGLPTMVGPLVALLRELVAMGEGGESGRPHLLAAGHDPGLASTWTSSLHRIETPAPAEPHDD